MQLHWAYKMFSKHVALRKVQCLFNMCENKIWDIFRYDYHTAYSCQTIILFW